MLAVASCVAMTSDRITAAGAKGERTISFYHIHTQERLTVTFKKDGAYIPSAMRQINWILRDWRKNKATEMSPGTIDLAWEMHQELGSREPINIISGYRSRGTNEMLRKTRGGQASQSQHITGKAIDISFPDVPLKRMRYSALIRERGGVGYYPTSGIPFVHIDTARVRSWPRLPRYELALVFPEGRSQHMPTEGGPITPGDVRIAQTKHRELAVQVAAFHDARKGLRAPTLVASATPAAPRAPAAPEPESAQRPAPAAADTPRAPRFAVASLGPSAVPGAADAPRKFDLKWNSERKPGAARPQNARQMPAMQLASLSEPAPLLPPKGSLGASTRASESKLVERPSRFTPSPADRGKLKDLFEQAAALPEPRLVREPTRAQRPQKQLAAVAAAVAAADGEPLPRYASLQLASLTPALMSASITDMSPDGLGNGWVQAPEFDDDHPEELAYRPFPLAPLLTETDSANDPQLRGELQHPDVAATLSALDEAGAIAPMKFRPGQQVAKVMWAQQFQGTAVHLDALMEIERGRLPAGLESRPVRTTSR